MIEYYSWPRVIYLAITILFAICVLAQTMSVVLSFYRYPRSRRWACETVLELLVLMQVFTSSLMHGQAVQGYEEGLIPQTDYILLRIIVFAAIIAVVAVITWMHRDPRPLPIILVSSLTLPAAEQLLGSIFPFLFTAALLFWLARGIIIVLKRTNEVKSEISAFSIKNAIDSMNTGILYCEKDGFILLANERMQQLMIDLTGSVQRNGRQFFSLLTLSDIQPGCRIVSFEGQNICLMPDGSAWSFKMTRLLKRKKEYIQVTAADITEIWKMTEDLQPQNEKLTQKQRDLHEALANVHTLSREMATQKAKMRAHDILGERLTMLLRVVRNESAPDYALLHKQSQELLSELKSTGNALTPQEDLEILIQTFAAIGVEVVQDGDPLAGGEHGRVMVDSIKEAVTNAVRDCFATKVLVSLDGTGQGGLLRIAHNGYEEE